MYGSQEEHQKVKQRCYENPNLNLLSRHYRMNQTYIYAGITNFGLIETNLHTIIWFIDRLSVI